MKILFLSRSLGQGGAERQLTLLAKGLRGRGHEVSVAVFYGGGVFTRDLADTGITVIDLKKAGRWDIVRFLWRLISCTRKNRPDVLHSYLGVPNILGVLIKPFIGQVRIVWGVRSSNMDLSRYDWLSRWSYRLLCQLSRFADMIIVNSNSGMEYAAKKGFPCKKMVVVPNGIDTGYFRPDVESRNRVRAEWDIRDGEFLIGLVGRLDPKKDHSTFLHAAVLLREQRDDVRFVCVGGGPGPYVAEMKLLATQLGLDGVLLWAGSRTDMPAVQNALDIASSSSSYGEGFPNVIGEAMACGVPCVVTDVGDTSKIVDKFGVVVPNNNPELLANGMHLLLKNLVNHDRDSIRSHILRKYSVDSLVSNTLEVIRRLDRPI